MVTPYTNIPFTTRLANAYFHANAAHLAAGKGRLRKGQFMQQAYPSQHYKNEASARRQFNKVIKGEISGKKIEIRGRVVRKRSMPQAGLWHAIVHFKHIERDGSIPPLIDCEEKICNVDYPNVILPQPPEGYEVFEPPNTHTMERSFTMMSYKYDRLEDVPYIYEILGGLVEDQIQKWLRTDSIPPVYWDVAMLVKPADYSGLFREQQVSLDNVEIE